MTEHPSTPRRRGSLLALLLVLVAALFAALVAVLVFGYPAYQGYLDRARESEAQWEVRRLAANAKSHFEGRPSGRCEFPRGAGPLPANRDCCGDCFSADPTADEQGWREVQFDRTSPRSFEWETFNHRTVFRVEARGDLDCDGVSNSYSIELVGHQNLDGTCEAVVGTLLVGQTKAPRGAE